MVVVTEPFGSSVESLVVGTVRVALPVVGIVTVWVPVVTPKSPLWVTVVVTSNAEAGDGFAVTVNDAAAPSVTSPSEAILTVGPESGWPKTQGRACLIASLLAAVILNSISMAKSSPSAGL